MKKALLIFLALALFDALVGGALASFLQRGGWTPGDQQINDTYQAVYAAVIACSLLLTAWKKFIPKMGTLGILVLLFGYLEDTLFYILIHVTNPLIKLMVGAPYRTPGGGLFPETISGYLGWVGRHLINIKISLEMPIILAINSATIFIFIILWIFEQRSKKSLPA